MENYLITLGNNLKTLREEKGYSTREIESYLDISKSAVSNYENAMNDPQLSVIMKYAEFFDVDVNWLLGIVTERGRFHV
jgi:transcriptional regulator with XRE-family HTH domain